MDFSRVVSVPACSQAVLNFDYLLFSLLGTIISNNQEIAHTERDQLVDIDKFVRILKGTATWRCFRVG